MNAIYAINNLFKCLNKFKNKFVIFQIKFKALLSFLLTSRKMRDYIFLIRLARKDYFLFDFCASKISLSLPMIYPSFLELTSIRAIL